MDFPTQEEYNHFFATYINHLPKANPIQLLEKTQVYALSILKNIPSKDWNYKYDVGKWTIKELVMHMIDCEQILAYRALRFARGDVKSALSFDEDAYVAATSLETMDSNYLLQSTELLRQYTVHLFRGFNSQEQLQGGSSSFPCSVRATAAIIAGHQLHHIYVLQERYLKQPIQQFVV